MGREEQIDDQVIRNLSWFGYEGALWIRRAKLGREGFGAVDLLLLPATGPHRVVLVEVKHAKSSDTPGRLVGQLLAYYLAALRLGADGIKRLCDFAREPRAHGIGSKSLQMMSGLGAGSKHKDLEALRSGKQLAPDEVALIIVIGTDKVGVDSRESFGDLRAWLRSTGHLDIRVAMARSDGSFE